MLVAALAAPAAAPVASSFPLMEKLSVETMAVAARTDDAINAAAAAVSSSPQVTVLMVLEDCP